MVAVVVVESNFLFLNLTLKMDLKASWVAVCFPCSQRESPHLFSGLALSLQHGKKLSEAKKMKMNGLRQELETMDTPITDLKVSHQVSEHLRVWGYFSANIKWYEMSTRSLSVSPASWTRQSYRAGWSAWTRWPPSGPGWWPSCLTWRDSGALHAKVNGFSGASTGPIKNINP